MSSDNTDLGDRMKRYEEATRSVLPRRTYTIVRVDGRAFHSYLRGAAKPYDTMFMCHMDMVAAALCKEMSGSVFAYVQSDEISVLLTDFDSLNSEPWFGGNVQKMCSTAAATASVRLMEQRLGTPTFDARVFTIADVVEVANYFVWRQGDCVRNSIQMAGRAKFSHRDLHQVSTGGIQAMLFSNFGINWNDYPDGCKRGRVVVKEIGQQEVTYTHKRTGEEVTEQAIRSWWGSRPAPHFVADDVNFLALEIPNLPRLRDH